jgi:hypothetical protein
LSEQNIFMKAVLQPFAAIFSPALSYADTLSFRYAGAGQSGCMLLLHGSARRWMLLA